MRGVFRWCAGAVSVSVALAAGLAAAETVGKSTGPLDGRNVREGECSLGDLVADAARAAVGAEVALVQASQIRSQVIPAGDLTREVLTGALLYPDEKVVLVEVSGAQLRTALERGLSMLPNPSTAFLQISGMTVTFRSDSPAEQRIVEAQVGGIALSGERIYKAAMPLSLAKGALGYFRVFNGLQPKQTGPGLGDALCNYVPAARRIPPQSGRLRDLSRPPG